jgi:hypothetical protein
MIKICEFWSLHSIDIGHEELRNKFSNHPAPL